MKRLLSRAELQIPSARLIAPTIGGIPLSENELKFYERQAERVGFFPNELINAKFVLLLHELKIPIYDTKEVSSFLDVQSEKQGKTWGWAPLRPIGAGTHLFITGYWYKRFFNGNYNETASQCSCVLYDMWSPEKTSSKISGEIRLMNSPRPTLRFGLRSGLT